MLAHIDLNCANPSLTDGDFVVNSCTHKLLLFAVFRRNIGKKKAEYWIGATKGATGTRVGTSQTCRQHGLFRHFSE